MAHYFAADNASGQPEPLTAADIIRTLQDPQDTIAAALIERDLAAVPVMVAALRAILSHPRTSDDSIVYMPREIAAARAALAKAQG